MCVILLKGEVSGKETKYDEKILSLGLAKAVFLWYTNTCTKSTRGTAG